MVIQLMQFRHNVDTLRYNGHSGAAQEYMYKMILNMQYLDTADTVLIQGDTLWHIGYSGGA